MEQALRHDGRHATGSGPPADVLAFITVLRAGRSGEQRWRAQIHSHTCGNVHNIRGAPLKQ
jgi:hypothetical protein